jgi:hypothetical protein
MLRTPLLSTGGIGARFHAFRIGAYVHPGSDQHISKLVTVLLDSSANLIAHRIIFWQGIQFNSKLPYLSPYTFFLFALPQEIHSYSAL